MLKILTGRVGASKKLTLKGTIRLDGKVVDPTNIGIRKQIAYVEQDVSIPATCTPREAITFSARLRLDKSLSNKEINNVVDDILDNLGLTHVADTLIGGGPLMAGGLSGGEKKRVQCGVELVTNPEIVVLDEPVSFSSVMYICCGFSLKSSTPLAPIYSCIYLQPLYYLLLVSSDFRARLIFCTKLDGYSKADC